MNFAATLLPQRVVDALGWTLFHSLWQGALAALGFAAVLYFSRRASARLRYGLGLAALALMLLASALTFANHYGAAVAAPAAPTANALVPAAPAPAAAPPNARQPLAAFFSDYFGRHLPLLVTLWLLGVLFLSLRFAGGLLYLQRLKHNQSRPLPAPWPERLQALAARAGLRRPLRLLESLRLRTPAVVGHLKPVLLLPAGLVTGLSASEVEALLAHELAHVLRRDYLVNIVQNLVGIVYFFHPGVRWISACVRQEREHCCDDFAVELCGDPRGYARALASLQAGGAFEPALAAVGRPQRLLRRIARLLAMPRLAHDFREGFASALLLVVGLLAVLRLAAVPAAAPAGGAAPAAAAHEAVKPSNYEVVSFALAADATVKLSGKVPVAWSGMAGSWLIREEDGGLAWMKTLAAGAPFAEPVALKRGAYAWYLPAGSRGALQQKKGGSGQWTALEIGPERGEFRIQSGSERDRLSAQEEKARLAAEVAALMAEKAAKLDAEEMARAEAENAKVAMELERVQAEAKKLQQEQGAMAEAGKRAIEAEKAKLEAEEAKLREKERQLAASELKLQEKMRFEEQRRLQEVEKQLFLQQQELAAQEEKLKLEEKRLQAEEAKLRKFLAELARLGLINGSRGYEIRMAADSLVIDGKRQSPETLARVRQLYESIFARKLPAGEPLQIVHDGD